MVLPDYRHGRIFSFANSTDQGVREKLLWLWSGN